MRTALITGTSSGFGLLTTVELARRGWRVTATMRDPGKREALDRALGEAGAADKVEIVALDVTDTKSIPATIERVIATCNGRLDAVVHNAGAAAPGAFEDVPEAELRRVMDTNLFGVLELTRAVLPTFREQRQGRIVVVSSDSALIGEPCNAIYCASKWAIEGWAESFAYEVEPFGIDVVLVQPGPYKTGMWHGSPRHAPDESAYAPLVRQVLQSGNAHFDRMARDPIEVAHTIVKALEARRPRFRYPVGPQARALLALHHKLPTSLVRSIMRRTIGLHRLKI
ncbi:MAG: SDR family NAD(P)-dependent oxidoreductase [Hyphomicrobiaceae bacterium]